MLFSLHIFNAVDIMVENENSYNLEIMFFVKNITV